MQRESDGPEEVEKAREALCERVLGRAVEGNQLRPEGVEDRYVFSPGATIEEIGTDEGRNDLAQPARERTWFRVTYPSKDHALFDTTGRPIRTLDVAVNVSAEGAVLKASVVGNVEINRASVCCDWGEDKGE